MQWTFHVLLQRSESGRYSLTFYQGNISAEHFPIRGISFARENSVRDFLSNVLQREDAEHQLKEANATSQAVGFWQNVDESMLGEIRKVAGNTVP